MNEQVLETTELNIIPKRIRNYAGLIYGTMREWWLEIPILNFRDLEDIVQNGHNGIGTTVASAQELVNISYPSGLFHSDHCFE